MANLFGLDVAALVAESIAGSGGVMPGTLTKTAPGAAAPGSLTAGNNPTTTVHALRGFAEKRSNRRQGSILGETISVVTILGASVSPAAVPEVEDTVLIDGTTYLLVELLSRDPAAAVYEFRANS